MIHFISSIMSYYYATFKCSISSSWKLLFQIRLQYIFFDLNTAKYIYVHKYTYIYIYVYI